MRTVVLYVYTHRVRISFIFLITLQALCVGAAGPDWCPPVSTCAGKQISSLTAAGHNSTAKLRQERCGVTTCNIDSELSPYQPYTIFPVNAGVTLNPPGASVALAITSEQYAPTVRLSTTLGYDRSLGASDGMYGYLRYEIDRGIEDKAVAAPTTFSVRAGTWPHSPHRTPIRTTAYGVEWGVQALLSQRPVLSRAKLDIGLIGLLNGASRLALDSRGEFAVSSQTTDRWGYSVSGWQGTLSGIWNSTGTDPSLALWANSTYTSVSTTPFPLDLGLRLGYRPAWPIPIPATSEIGILGTAGTHFKLPTRLSIGKDIVNLKRVTIEPRVRAWSDETLGFGADATLSLDTIVNRNRIVSVGSTVGHANGLWYRLNLRIQP